MEDEENKEEEETDKCWLHFYTVKLLLPPI